MATYSTPNPFQRAKRFLIGKPLPTTDAGHQTISNKVGLAVFASDALSSTAYATESILEVLAAAVPVAGLAVLGFSLPISIAIVVLLAIVTISYQQTIHAYPGGGGAYIVARDNLGEAPAQMAGAALLTDYILTVSVSISSGVAQITSAFPQLYPFRVEIAIALVAFMTIINLRGVKESGLAFAVPTYFFLGVTMLTIGYGLFQFSTGTLSPVTGVTPAEVEALQGVTLFLILHAFSSGCTALTGVEAISNGITAFHEPKSRNAGVTLIWMSVILSSMFIGITFLANNIGAQFSRTETVISQLGRAIWGPSIMWYVLLGGTTLILIMAANTSFADFPRLAALQAGDGFLPKQLTYRGSRLVFTYGIIALAALACVLIVLFQAVTTALIPLYAIGVFLSFTLSQGGMAVRWWKSGRLIPGEEIVERGSTLRHDEHWHLKLLVNGLGAVVTFVVMLVFAYTKFADGAWIVIFIIPALVFIFFRIHKHYRSLAAELSLEKSGEPSRIVRNRVIFLIGGVHRGILHALRYTRSLSPDVTAMYVSVDPLEEERVKQKWERWGDGVRLHIIQSPYRRLNEPLLEYIDKMAGSLRANEMLTVVVPQFVPDNPIYNALHMNTALFLRTELLNRTNIVVMEVPYHIHEGELVQQKAN
jgi:amino acid transporter